MLESHGYQVDIYLGRNATLEVFLEIGFYDIVIIRAHGGYTNRSVGPYPPGGHIYTELHVDEAVKLYGPSIYNWIRKGILAEGVIPPPKASMEDLSKLPKYVIVSRSPEPCLHVADCVGWYLARLGSSRFPLGRATGARAPLAHPRVTNKFVT